MYYFKDITGLWFFFVDGVVETVGCIHVKMFTEYPIVVGFWGKFVKKIRALGEITFFDQDSRKKYLGIAEEVVLRKLEWCFLCLPYFLSLKFSIMSRTKNTGFCMAAMHGCHCDRSLNSCHSLWDCEAKELGMPSKGLYFAMKALREQGLAIEIYLSLHSWQGCKAWL